MWSGQHQSGWSKSHPAYRFLVSKMPQWHILNHMFAYLTSIWIHESIGFCIHIGPLCSSTRVSHSILKLWDFSVEKGRSKMLWFGHLWKGTLKNSNISKHQQLKQPPDFCLFDLNCIQSLEHFHPFPSRDHESHDSTCGYVPEWRCFSSFYLLLLLFHRQFNENKSESLVPIKGNRSFWQCCRPAGETMFQKPLLQELSGGSEASFPKLYTH